MSAKPIADKLLIKAGSSVWLSDPGRRDLVGPLPDGAIGRRSARSGHDRAGLRR